MPALITGANGQLGLELRKLLPDAIATDSAELDITDAAAVQRYDWSGVDAIYNSAAFTDVDGAETQADLADRVNHLGAANLAEAARAHHIPLIHLSTDYVFDGTATEPYPVDAPLNPQSQYGKTKATGEQAVAQAPQHYIIRTSWLYGDGNNFVRTMLRLGRERNELTVVNDQRGRPTSALDLAQALVHLVRHKAPYGTYHFSNAGSVISWAEFAAAIFQIAKIDCKVTPITTAEYLKGKTGIAPRPAYGALDLASIEAVGITPPDWHDSLADYIRAELSKPA